MALETALASIDETLAGLASSGMIPPTVEVTVAGSASKLASIRGTLLGDGTLFGALGSSFGLALVVVFLLIAILFQSFRLPIVIMLAVPLATVGGFAALFGVFLWSATDPYMPLQTLDILTMLGFVLLIGVVVNNAILIVHQALNFMRGEDGETPDLRWLSVSADAAAKASGGRLPPREAIAESVRTRIRPIFMSTLTSVGGMLPLVLMPGAGSELYRGIGSVVVGGLLVSTVFTILLVPLLMNVLLPRRFARLAESAGAA
jgi:HAE1 family hydrophobic/amphiphilic exporter-1